MRRRYRVEGVVQGVGFRFFTLRAARRLALVGWVRNLPDGSVEVEAIGPLELLQRFEAELARGPAGGTVVNLGIEELGEGGADSSTFEIR